MKAKTDIWMPLYIGDYLADTVMLNAEQSGCYLHWLMAYWRTGPLEDDLPALIQMGKLTSDDASSIAQALLKRFFVKNGDGHWHQKRMDIEKEGWLAKKQKAKEKASRAATNRWSSKDAPSNASSNQQAMLEKCPSSSSSPLPKKQELKTIFVLPDWVPKEQWDAWMPVRKAKKAANTPHALEIAVRQLARLKIEGFNPADVLEQSILRGYTGLFPLQRNQNGGNHGKQNGFGGSRSKTAGNFDEAASLLRELDYQEANLAGDSETGFDLEGHLSPVRE